MNAKCSVAAALALGLWIPLLVLLAAPAWGQSPPPTQSVTLAWDPSPDPSVAGYCFYVAAWGTASPPQRVDVGSQTQFTITNLQRGVTYLFYVTAYDGAHTESDPSNQITHTPGGPNPPDQLRAVVTGSHEVTLLWNDNSTNEDGFNIERSLDGTNFTFFTTTGPDVTRYTVVDQAGFPAATYPYWFRVSAFQGFTTSPYSNLATAITNKADLEVLSVAAVPATPVEGAPVWFSATVVNVGAAATMQGVGFRLAFQIDGGAPIAWADASNSIPPGGTLTLVATDGPGGQSSWQAAAGFHTVNAVVIGPDQPSAAGQSLSLLLLVAPANRQLVLAGVPADATAECDAVPAPPVVTATDNCGPTPLIAMTETRLPGGCPQSYRLVRTWTATDACGNQNTATQILTVRDATPPVLVGVPADAAVEYDAVPTAPVVTTVDNCDPAPVVTMTESRTAGSCLQNYNLIRTWTATDACGNQRVATQILTVQDTTPPVLVGVPPDTTVASDAVPPPPVVTATDSADPAPVVTMTETNLPGISTPGYQLVRTWTATDACGNQTSARQTITVQPAAVPPWQWVALANTSLHFSWAALASPDSNSPATSPSFVAAVTNLTLAGGWVGATPGGAFWYLPPSEAFAGTDSLFYAVSNSAGATVCATGAVLVVSNPTVPAVAVDPPTVGVLVTLRGEVPLSATVNDPAQRIARVEFFAGQNLVAVATNRVGNSYSALWSGAGTALWTLSATAYTSDRQIIGSPSVPLFLVALPLSAAAGRNVVVEVSPDLVNWTVIKFFSLGSSPLNAAPGAFNVTDQSSATVRFYRARTL